MSSSFNNDNNNQHDVPIIPPFVNDPELSSSLKEYGHHLVVHFDINETILVGDQAGGDTREDCLNKMLAKAAFVRMMPSADQNDNGNDSVGGVSYEETSAIIPTHWWNDVPIGKEGGDNDDDTSLSAPPPLYIGWEWPAGCCPYYRTALKMKAKMFTELDGAPYRGVLRKIEQGLHHRDIPELPQLGNMLPAFFYTLQHFSKSKQKKTLVFRTMGTDLPEIARAVTAFAQGKHPDYPDFYDPTLVMSRDSIVKGRWHRNPENGSTIYQLFQGGDGSCSSETMVAAGDQEILDFIHSRTVCGIQDDYEFWNANNYEPWSGKPVWQLPDVHHVLLDDNIHNLKNDAIASIRRQVDVIVDEASSGTTTSHTFETLTSTEILAEQGRHLIRVPTIAPILHPSWFLEVINMAQESFALSNKKGDSLVVDFLKE